MRRARATTTLVALVTAALLGLVGLSGCSAAGDDAVATHNDADVSFVAAMIPHHEQALQMVEITEGRDLDPAFTALAEEIRTAQEAEVAQLRRWQEAWAESDGGETGSSGGLSMGGDMDGMMSGEQLDRLAQARDGSFRRLWLQSMIEHHQGALAMAESELEAGLAPDAVELARTIRDAQQDEITRMQALLAG